MPITTDKLLLFRSHVCSRGLSEETLQEISAAAELVKFDTGEYVHHANQAIESVFLVVHGRLKQAVVDMHGKVIFHRFLTRGSQFGALAAAQVDPVPVDVLAVEPSAALKLDFDTTLRFTREHETFGFNLTRTISNMVSQVLLSDRQPKKPPFVSVFHESPESRPLTGRLIQRLLELGESPCLLSDQTDMEPIESVPFRSLIEDDQFLTREDFRRQINQWSESERVFWTLTLHLIQSMQPCSSSLASK